MSQTGSSWSGSRTYGATLLVQAIHRTSTGSRVLTIILNPGMCCESEYLWYESTSGTSGKMTDLLFRKIPGPIPVMWNFTSCEERKKTAIEFYYAMSGNKITCLVRKMGTRMTIKKFMEELTIHMTFSNQASRFQVYKPWDPMKYKPNSLITIK